MLFPANIPAFTFGELASKRFHLDTGRVKLNTTKAKDKPLILERVKFQLFSAVDCLLQPLRLLFFSTTLFSL